jgi:arginase
VHIDLDALDEEALPAVTYGQPLALDWPDFEDLLAPLVASAALLGGTLADFNADHDPNGIGRSASST